MAFNSDLELLSAWLGHRFCTPSRMLIGDHLTKTEILPKGNRDMDRTYNSKLELVILNFDLDLKREAEGGREEGAWLSGGFCT